MFEIMMLTALTVSVLLNIWLAVRDERIRRVIQVAVDKTERDRGEYARIPLNQLIELGFSSRHGISRTRAEFNHDPGPHPATLRPAKRRKL